jgi:hypothetical protein
MFGMREVLASFVSSRYVAVVVRSLGQHRECECLIDRFGQLLEEVLNRDLLGPPSSRVIVILGCENPRIQVEVECANG